MNCCSQAVPAVQRSWLDLIRRAITCSSALPVVHVVALRCAAHDEGMLGAAVPTTAHLVVRHNLYMSSSLHVHCNIQHFWHNRQLSGQPQTNPHSRSPLHSSHRKIERCRRSCG